MFTEVKCLTQVLKTAGCFICEARCSVGSCLGPAYMVEMELHVRHQEDSSTGSCILLHVEAPGQDWGCPRTVDSRTDSGTGRRCPKRRASSASLSSGTCQEQMQPCWATAGTLPALSRGPHRRGHHSLVSILQGVIRAWRSHETWVTHTQFCLQKSALHEWRPPPEATQTCSVRSIPGTPEMGRWGVVTSPLACSSLALLCTLSWGVLSTGMVLLREASTFLNTPWQKSRLRWGICHFLYLFNLNCFQNSGPINNFFQRSLFSLKEQEAIFF